MSEQPLSGDEIWAAWQLVASTMQPTLLGRSLPRRVRLRLAFTRCIDRIGIWLVEHQQFCAATALWRAFRLW